ncbi:hypothetical protein P4O66_003129 [Electrophorus voltai]|uniref:Uncharacterized protein n=1 Tax=Electrophorus voltai TaxID=2609070 RepID=A0AAD9DLA2_9TELE|nr:hypothetical protein P4O66_003129 [Electrophorus voltai]
MLRRARFNQGESRIHNVVTLQVRKTSIGDARAWLDIQVEEAGETQSDVSLCDSQSSTSTALNGPQPSTPKRVKKKKKKGKKNRNTLDPAVVVEPVLQIGSLCPCLEEEESPEHFLEGPGYSVSDSMGVKQYSLNYYGKGKAKGQKDFCNSLSDAESDHSVVSYQEMEELPLDYVSDTESECRIMGRDGSLHHNS